MSKQFSLEALMPAGLQNLLMSKMEKLFEADAEGNTTACFVIKQEQETDDSGNPLFHTKGRKAGTPQMTIIAIPYANDICSVNNELYNGVITANATAKTLLQERETLQAENASLRSHIKLLREQIINNG